MSGTIRVRFENVGRGRKSWEDDVTEDDALPGTPEMTALESALDRGGALMSRDTGCDFNPDDSYQSGTCYAGGRTVGSWHVVERAAPLPAQGKDGGT